MSGSDSSGLVRKKAPAREAPMFSGPLARQQVVLDPLETLREQRPDGVVERVWAVGLELHAVLDVVHKVFAHTRQVANHLDPVLLQERTWTDATDLEQLRGVQRTRAEDHVAAGRDAELAAVLAVSHAVGALAVEVDTGDECLCHHLQIRLLACRLQVDDVGRGARTVPGCQVPVPGALNAVAVEVVVLRNAQLVGRGLPTVVMFDFLK